MKEPDGSFRTTASRLIAPVYIPIVMLSLSWSLVLPSFPQYLAGLGAGVAVVGLVLALKGAGQLASDVPGGVLIARLGVTNITLTSFGAAIIANTALAFARPIALIGVLIFVSGFFSSILITGAMTTVRRRVPPEFRGRALALAGGAMRIGAFIGPVAGGAIAERYGVPVVFAVRAGAFLLGGLSFFFSLVGERAQEHEDYSVSDRRTSSLVPGNALERLREGLRGRYRAVVTVGFAILILSVLRAARQIVIPLWGASIGLTPAVIGLAMSIGAAADLVLFLPAGIISDRFGRRVAAFACITLFSIGFLAFLPVRSLAGFVAAAMIVGLGNGLGAGINMTTGTDLAPRQAVPEFIGLWRMYGDIGTALGPAVVGAVAGVAALAPAVVTIAALGASGAAVLALFAPETRDLN